MQFKAPSPSETRASAQAPFVKPAGLKANLSEESQLNKPLNESQFENALFFEPGVTRFFGVGDIGNKGLLAGWAIPEDAHVWNDGLEAQLLVAIEMPNQACALTVQGRPFISSRQPQQEVTLFANGARVGFWRFRDGGPQVMTSVIEPEYVLARGKKGILKLTWHMPSSVRPSEIGEGEDGRELGFVFQSINLSYL